ncbi:hypothetical protein [Rosistilla oblonga]
MQNATQPKLPTQTSGEETDESGASNERKYQHEAQASDLGRDQVIDGV